ncbi:MAG: respiratory nitrate reductase subunit gamma [Acidimicrobiales bacterium]
MSTAEADTEATDKPKGVKPSQLVIGLGVGIAIFTALSGIAGAVLGWHDESEVAREVFVGIPGALQAVFYVVVCIAIIAGAVMFSWRVKNWERGRPDNRSLKKTNAEKRAKDFRAGVYMQTLMRDPVEGMMHSLIYFSFLILLAVTTILEIDHQLPPDLKFLHGGVYQAYAFVGDVAGLLFTIGVVWAILRRYIAKPYRLRIKTKPQHAVILGVFLAIGVSGFLTEAMRIAQEGQPEFEKYAFVGYGLSYLFDGMAESTLNTWHQVWWVVHVVAFVAFLAILPVTMLRHMFTSPLNMYLRDRDRPKGAMRPMPNLMETELESFGAATVEDFTWKQLLDTDACTMCGRCTAVCPAHATGKSLDPREIVLKTGEVMAATAANDVSPPSGWTRRSRSAPTRCSSASAPKRCGRARRARRATRTARSTSRSSTRSSTCAATCR